MSTDLTPTIGTVAGGPAHVSGDAGEFTAQPLSALIAADQYLKASAGAALPNRGLRFTKLIPAGAMDDCGGTREGPSFNGGCP